MNLLRIALLQILPQGSLEENRQKGICACIEAKKAGADIALFPEMWSNGYHVPEYPDRLRLESIPAAGEFVRTFGRLAAQLDMAMSRLPEIRSFYLTGMGKRRSPTPRFTPAILMRSGI